MRISQETGTRARAGLFWTAPSPGAFVEVFHWNYVVGSASASPASLWTNERRPSRAIRHLGSPRSARRCPHQVKAGARRGRRAGATLPSTSSGASRRTRCARFSSRRRTGGAAGACWAWVLGRRPCEGLPFGEWRWCRVFLVAVDLRPPPSLLRFRVWLSAAVPSTPLSGPSILPRLELWDGGEVSL